MSVNRNESCVCDARRESCDVFSRDIWREVQSMDCDRPKQLDSWLSLRQSLSLNLDGRLLTRQQFPDWKCASRTTVFTVISLVEELRGRELRENSSKRAEMDCGAGTRTSASLLKVGQYICQTDTHTHAHTQRPCYCCFDGDKKKWGQETKTLKKFRAFLPESCWFLPQISFHKVKFTVTELRTIKPGKVPLVSGTITWTGWEPLRDVAKRWPLTDDFSFNPRTFCHD